MDSPRILVVDDCRMTSLLLKHILGKLGVRVDSAADGRQGLEMALSHPYPLIFLDVMLPQIDGFEVCRQIREAEFERQPRVIVLTAMGEEYSPERCKNSGVDGIFFKPLVPSQIVEIARETLAQIETQPSPTETA